MPPRICGILVQSKTTSVTWRVMALPSHSPGQPGPQRTPSPGSPSCNAAPCQPAPVSPLGLKPWDSFLPPRRAQGPTSAVTSLLHGEEGAEMRSQGKGGRNSEPSWFLSHNEDLLKWELGLVLDFASPGRMVIN